MRASLAYLLTIFLWASPLLNIQLLAADTKIEGLILEKGINELLVLEVDSYESISIPITASTKIKRDNHKGITFDDLRKGWFVEVKQKIEKNGNRTTKEVKVKVDRFKKVELDAFLEDFETEGVIVVDGQNVITKKARIKRKKDYEGALKPGLKVKVKGIRLEDGSVEAREIEVEPNECEDLEWSILYDQAHGLSKLKLRPAFNEVPTLQEYISGIGNKLIPAVVQENYVFRFHVIREPTINAFAVRSFSFVEGEAHLIQGSIYVNTGLLKVLKNEAQLATVLGREVAHVTHEHGTRRPPKRTWSSFIPLQGVVALQAAGTSGVPRRLWDVGLGRVRAAILNGYDRDFEDQADRVGLRYLYEAGYDPMEAPKTWDIFSKRSGDQDKEANYYYGSHSTHGERKHSLFSEIAHNYRETVNRKHDCELVVKEEDYKINVRDGLDALAKPPAEGGAGLVYIFRAGDDGEKSEEPPVFLTGTTRPDTAILAEMDNGRYIKVRLLPDKYTFFSDNEEKPSIHLTVEAGQEYFLEMDSGLWDVKGCLLLSNREGAMPQITKLKPLDKKFIRDKRVIQ